MELGELKQEVLRNLEGSLLEAQDTVLESVITAAVEDVKDAESSDEVLGITVELKGKIQEIRDLEIASRIDENLEELSADAELEEIFVRIDLLQGLFSVNERKKMKELFSGYRESVATAREIDPRVVILPVSDVYNVFSLLGPILNKEILKFKKPTLLVVPNNSFSEKISAMDSNRRYFNQNFASVWQQDSYLPIDAIGTPEKTFISVVDGGPQMPHVPGIDSDSRWDHRKEMFKLHFLEKGLKLINVHEYAVLMQRSLCEYKKKGNDVVIDSYQQGRHGLGLSCLGDEFLPADVINLACFDFFNSRICFYNVRPTEHYNGGLRARPSVIIKEYDEGYLR
jgi:hypothetical protein